MYDDVLNQVVHEINVEFVWWFSHNKLVSVAVTHGGGPQSEVYEVQAELEIIMVLNFLTPKKPPFSVPILFVPPVAS